MVFHISGGKLSKSMNQSKITYEVWGISILIFHTKRQNTPGQYKLNWTDVVLVTIFAVLISTANI